MANLPDKLLPDDIFFMLLIGEYQGEDLNATPVGKLPSQGRFESETGLSKAAVYDRFAKLMRAELVEEIPEDEENRPRVGVTLYRLTDAGLRTLDEVFSQRDAGADEP